LICLNGYIFAGNTNLHIGSRRFRLQVVDPEQAAVFSLGQVNGKVADLEPDLSDSLSRFKLAA
jgi:hypothetical protein